MLPVRRSAARSGRSGQLGHPPGDPRSATAPLEHAAGAPSCPRPRVCTSAHLQAPSQIATGGRPEAGDGGEGGWDEGARRGPRGSRERRRERRHGGGRGGRGLRPPCARTCEKFVEFVRMCTVTAMAYGAAVGGSDLLLVVLRGLTARIGRK